jgi:hypothetical protein
VTSLMVSGWGLVTDGLMVFRKKVVGNSSDRGLSVVNKRWLKVVLKKVVSGGDSKTRKEGGI